MNMQKKGASNFTSGFVGWNKRQWHYLHQQQRQVS